MRFAAGFFGVSACGAYNLWVAEHNVGKLDVEKLSAA
jgi:hypothetical protein